MATAGLLTTGIVLGLLLKIARTDMAATVVFLFLFYGGLVGSKLMVAVAVGRSRHVLHSTAYIWAIGSLGILLVVIAGFFFKVGVGSLGWL